MSLGIASFGQGDSNKLQTAQDQYNQGKFKESAQSFKTYFEEYADTDCSLTLLEPLETWAMASLISREQASAERLLAVENCAKSLGQDSLWASYLIHHGEALRTMNRKDEAKEKFFLALSYPNLTAEDKAQSYAVLSYCYVNEKGDSTVLYANRALEIALKIKDTIAILESYHALGSHARAIGKLHEAILWNRRSLKFQKGKYKIKKPETFGNISQLFSTLKDYPKAEKYIDSVYQTVDTTLYIQFTALLKMKEGYIFKNTNRIPQAKQKYLLALKKLKDPEDKYYCLKALAEIEKRLENNSQSEKYLSEALALGDDLDASGVQKTNALIRARKAYANNNYEECIASSEKALSIQENDASLSYSPEIFLYLARASEKLQQQQKSLNYYKRYYHARDSLNNLINQELVYTLENEYTVAEQDKSLSKLNLQNTLQQLKLRQQRWFGIGILLFLLLFAATIFFLVRLNKKIKRQTLTIQEAVLEKNILLKEIHHRVKNNLQVISSLFNMQSRFVKDDNALNALKESHNRVNSLALLHQNLYQEENLKGIEMPSYIDQLCDALFNAASNTNDQVRYENKISPLTLDIDTVIPLGLILTELITSALKRNYSGDTPATIQVELKEIENALSLCVRDNSTNEVLESDLDKKSFSQKIIDAFSKKLKASLQYNIDNGTEIRMTIQRYRIAG